MFCYAQINKNNICMYIATSTNKISQSDMILLDFYDEDKLYRKIEDGVWSEEKYPEGFVKTVQDYYDEKATELLNSCYADIYGKFTIWDKWFACDQTARDDINDLVYASQKPDFNGRYWFAFGGVEIVFITKEMVEPFKDAVVLHKDNCWNKYAMLSNQLKAIDLSAPDAIQQIQAIIW